MNCLDFHNPARAGKYYLRNLDDAESESANQVEPTNGQQRPYESLRSPSTPLGPLEVNPYMLL